MKLLPFFILSTLLSFLSLHLLGQSNNCAFTTFQKTYGKTTIYNWVQEVVETPDHGFITGGRGGDVLGCFLMKVDYKGNVVWNHQIKDTLAYRGFMEHFIRLKNGNYFALGRAYYPNPDKPEIWMMEFDDNGNIIWNKKINYPDGIGLIDEALCETSDGGIVILGGYSPFANYAGSALIKLDQAGNMIWAKNCFNSVSTHCIMEKNGILYLGGIEYYSLQGGIVKLQGVLLKMKSSDGSFITARKISVGKITDIFSISERNNLFYLNGTATSNRVGSDTLNQIVMIADSNFNILKAHQLNLNYRTGWQPPTLFPTADSGFVASESNESPVDGDADLMLFKLSYNGNIEWKKRYLHNGYQHLYRLKQTSDNGMIGVGISNDFGHTDRYYNQLYLVKADSAGNTGNCPVTDPFLEVFTPSIINTPVYYYYFNTTYPIIDIHSTYYSTTLPIETFCENQVIPTCSLIKVSGLDSVCVSSDRLTYKAIRNSGCTSPLDWVIDSSFISVISKTDSSIQVTFKKPGIVTLKAVISGLCNYLADTFSVHIFDAPKTLNLGPDITLCEKNKYTLHAGPGFRQYRWQDGSTDSLYVVNNPGIYFVSAYTYCGEMFSDTINIIGKPAVTLSLSSDTIKCNHDSLWLKASPGFLSYEWSPNYAISQQSAQSVLIYPDTSIVYRVKATQSEGCVAYDSVKITVHHSPNIDLGPDINLCAGNSVSLDAGNGFSTYVWNTGANSQQIIANNSGYYKVAATDINGCISKDSMQVLNVFPLPTVSLPKDTMLCSGTVIHLNVGNKFSKYLWQNGSTDQRFDVSQKGMYWIQVTDQNGCTNADTMQIKRVATVEAGFIPKDTSICEGSDNLIQARTGFRNYIWSTGETKDHIFIQTAGNYWLQVVSHEGCIARESIQVYPKPRCTTIAYFPNAFTPNRDGRNDEFRATVFGLLNKFHLIVYNRYGNKVFETYDYKKGWDGKVGDLDWSTETFAWYCEYEFKNMPEQIQKGTVTLIK